MDSDGSSHILSLSLILLLMVLLRAFFTVCETSVTEISDSKVRGYENKKGRKGLLFRLLQKPSALRAAFSAERTVSSVVSAFLAVYAYGARVTELFCRVGLSAGLSRLAAAVVVMYLTIVVLSALGDSIPHRIALSRDCDAFAVGCVYAVRLMMLLTFPVTALSSVLTSFSAAVTGISQTDAKDTVTEEEIMLMVDAGNETGAIEESEREMINNVFEFHALAVGEVMTHRTDMVCVSADADVSEVVYSAINSGFSRIPVYEGNADHIVGIVFVKDLLCLIGMETGEGVSVKSFMRDAEFVPSTSMCDDIFKQFTSEKIQMAIVVDEYGGTAGVVTMEDLVEAIVGNIQDEYDNEEDEITKISDDTYIISGNADPAEAAEQLGFSLPDDSDYDTMGGFITDLMGQLPEEDGERSIKYKNAVFTLLLVEDMRIVKIKAVLEKDSSDDNNERENNKDEEDEEEG